MGPRNLAKSDSPVVSLLAQLTSILFCWTDIVEYNQHTFATNEMLDDFEDSFNCDYRIIALDDDVSTDGLWKQWNHGQTNAP